MKGGQVDVPPRLTPGALNLQPRVAAADRPVDRRRRVDRAAVGPHAFVPAFAEKLVGFPDQRLAIGSRVGGLFGEDGRHSPGPAELLLQRLSVASTERRRVTFRRHLDAVSRKTANSRPLRSAQSYGCRCRPGGVAPPPARPPPHRKGGGHRPFESRRSGRTAGSQPAARGRAPD